MHGGFDWDPCMYLIGQVLPVSADALAQQHRSQVAQLRIRRLHHDSQQLRHDLRLLRLRLQNFFSCPASLRAAPHAARHCGGGEGAGGAAYACVQQQPRHIPDCPPIGTPATCSANPWLLIQVLEWTVVDLRFGRGQKCRDACNSLR